MTNCGVHIGFHCLMKMVDGGAPVHDVAWEVGEKVWYGRLVHIPSNERVMLSCLEETTSSALRGLEDDDEP
jgi:hypothetical protein